MCMLLPHNYMCSYLIFTGADNKRIPNSLVFSYYYILEKINIQIDYVAYYR